MSDPTKKDLNDQRQTMKQSERRAKELGAAAQEAQDKYNEKKLAKLNAENNFNKLRKNPTADKEKIEAAENAMNKAKKEMNDEKKARDLAKNKAKLAQGKAYQDKLDHTQMSNADYDKKNPEFEKYKNLMKDGPLNGFYKMFSAAVAEVVKFVKMFFYWIYKKSMMTFLPFIMTMSFAFSFIRYLFQNVRKG